MAGSENQKVKLYSTEWCPWCVRAKEFLRKNSISFEDMNIEKNPEWAEELQKKTGQTGVPVFEIKGKIIVGFDEKAIRQALGI